MKLKLATLALVPALAAAAGASLSAENDLLLKELPCASQVYSALEQWKEVPAGWRKEISTRPDLNVLSTPTDRVGVWFVLRVDGTQSATLARESPESRIVVKLEAPGCKAALSVFQGVGRKAARPGQFNDNSLETVLAESRKSGSTGVFYSWSPQMALSVKGLKEIREIAREKDYKLFALSDPNAKEASIQKFAKIAGFKSGEVLRLKSRELVRRGATLHFPTVLVFSKGRILPRINPGYESPNQLAKSIQGQLGS